MTERPPVPGWRYRGFVVHPLLPGPCVIAIAHVEGRKAVLDMVRESISIEECCALLKRYGITTVRGASDEGDALAHAALGAMFYAEGTP